MYRTLCVLAVLTLQAGLPHSFSWDIVATASNRLNFYNEEKLTHSVTFFNVNVNWITYDPFHNRVLFTNYSKSLLSFDMANGKIQTLIDLKPVLAFDELAYDPATGLLFVMTESYKIYSYLVKPGSNHEVEANFVIDLGGWSDALAVDSCGGYIYWIKDAAIQRARLNGSQREEVIERSDKTQLTLTIDPQTQTMYWLEFESKHQQYSIHSADLNGNHRRILNQIPGYYPKRLIVTKDFFYLADDSMLGSEDLFFWKLPKNLPFGTDVEPKKIVMNVTSNRWDYYKIYLTANYAIEEQSQGTPLCKALKRLLPNHSATNDSDSLNVSTGGSLLRVNETKVSGESRVSGDTCDVSVCHNYCLQGHCSTSADGQPKCRCNAGYSGVRCEVNECQNYCLNDGICSLSEQSNPVCQCREGYQGQRCDIPAFLIKCSDTVSMLKDILNADLTSVIEDKGVKATCASTVV